MNSEKDTNIHHLVPLNAPIKSAFEIAMEEESREIILNDYVNKLPKKPNENQIDRATDTLNRFRMTIVSGVPTTIFRALEIETQVKLILSEPTKLDKTKNRARKKNIHPNKAA